MKVTISVPSLTGGVSRQPAPLRLPQQAEVSDNMLASVIEGLRKRPPTEFVGQLLSFPTAASAQFAVRLQEGQFVIAANGDGIKVYDVESPGAPITVRNTAGGVASGADFDYLDTPDPRRDLRFVQLADFTLVLNRSKVVTASSTLTPAQKSDALVSIIAGAYARKYRIRVSHTDGDLCEVEYETHSSDGSPPGSVTVGPVATAERSAAPNTIASELLQWLTINAGGTLPGGQRVTGTELPAARWSVTRSGAVLRIRRLDDTDFTITISESQGSSTMKLAYKEVQLFSDLPAHAPAGMKMRVVGDPANSEASYWVEFEPALAGVAAGTLTDGAWRESVAPGVSMGLNRVTMPHALIRQADGEWQFTPLDGLDYLISGTPYPVPDWGLRLAGDDVTNPQPAFVGKVIQDLFYHEGRLGLLCEDALNLSEVREPFNFYRTSVVDLIDSERIEVKATQVRSERLTHAVPFGVDVVVFGDGAQYLLRSQGPLAPNTASFPLAGRHGCSPDAQPIQVGDALMAADSRGTYGSVQELRVAGDERPQLLAVDVTASVPGYLPEIRELLTTPQLQTMVALGEGTDMFVYTHFFNGGDRVQQAWQRWTLQDVDEIHYGWMHDTNLHLVLKRGADVVLEQMRLAPFETDDGDPVIHLDRRLTDAQCTVTTPVAGQTHYVLPFDAAANTIVMEQGTGRQRQILALEGDTIDVAGDPAPVYIGTDYECRHDLTRPTLHDDRQGPVADGVLRLDEGEVYFDGSGPFEARVIPDSGVETVCPFAGPYLGQGANYQSMRPMSGKFRFPIRGRASDVTVSFRSRSPWPLRLISVDFNGRLVGSHGRRM